MGRGGTKLGRVSWGASVRSSSQGVCDITTSKIQPRVLEMANDEPNDPAATRGHGQEKALVTEQVQQSGCRVSCVTPRNLTEPSMPQFPHQ